jgi:hypothetical protein
MLQRNDPSLYGQLLECGGPLDIIFFGFEHNELHLYAKLYGVESIRTGPIYPTASSPGSIILGYGKPLGQVIEADANYWQAGLAEAVRNLIEIATRENPASVGPPISIVRITKAGAEWTEKAPHCPDIQAYWPKSETT